MSELFFFRNSYLHTVMITVFFCRGGGGGGEGVWGEAGNFGGEASTLQILQTEPRLKVDASGTSLVAGVLSSSCSKETLESWLTEANHISFRGSHP